jgi:hypothetical protein
MDDYPYRRSSRVLLAWLLLATTYSLWFQQRQALTGNHKVDGALSVLFGLYVCSRPAANAVDLLFFERQRFHRLVTKWSSIKWLALNILTLLMGWYVIYIGTAHLTSRAT